MYSQFSDRAGFAVRLPLLCAAMALTALAPAQDRQEVQIPERATELPARETVAGGEVREVALPQLDDAIPVPNGGIRYVETESGTKEILPQDSDPFFLGFVAGKYYPPAEERVDPLLRAAAAAIPVDRQQQVTFGFAMFSKRITEERLQVLRDLGATFLGNHPHYAAKLAFPAHSLDAIADLDFVRWIGMPRDWQKVHPKLIDAAQRAGAEQELTVWINVYDTDLNDASTFDYIGEGALVEPEQGVVGLARVDQGAERWMTNGWKQAALTSKGANISEYSDSIQAFRAKLTPTELAAVRDLDFVLFVELDAEPTSAHEESQPMCGVDLTRPSNSGGFFGDAVVGEADSGIENSHFILNHVFGIGWDLAGTAGGPWDDQNGHGTHVAGSIFGGSYTGNEAFYGAAPGLGGAADLRIFNVKIFDDNGSWGGASLQSIANLFHTDYNDGTNLTPKPHLLSNSWGTLGGGFVGSEADCRILDNESYIYRQLYVFAAGNEGPNAATLREEPSAKNVLTIGNVVPYRSGSDGPDHLRASSSRGPCGDGRWKPNVCAPGTSIDSADSANLSGYSSKTGTSMATPHVTGIAAQLVDRYDFLQYNPSTLSAVLMATALSETAHSTPTQSHLDNFGAGRVSAYRAIGGNSYQAMYFWGFTQPSASHVELDFSVFTGATRLTVCMNYHELASSAGASQALVQDIDTYIDRFPFSASGNSGEWSAQISHIDNTEIRTLINPAVESYRVKCYPTNVFANFRPFVGVCVIVDYGDLTPTGTLNMTTSNPIIKPGDPVTITGTVTNQSNGSIAQSVYLTAATGGMSLTSVNNNLYDGAVGNLIDNVYGGTEVMLGDMRHAMSRSVNWNGTFNTEGTKTFLANTLSPTMTPTNDSVQVIVDGTAPGLPQNVVSTDHTVGEHNCDLTVAMDWDAASDALSGIAGYSYLWTHSANSVPDAVVETSATSSNTALAASSSPWYFHVRAVDKAGNVGGTVHVGPFYVNTAQVTSYCNSNLNSTGQMALLTTPGAVCLGTESLTLRTVNLPKNQFGYYFMGQFKTNVPFFGGSQGVLCVGAPLYRFSGNVLGSGASGVMTFSPDFQNLPSGATFNHGSTWNFQLWYRDMNPGQTSNTSNGIEIIWD